MCCNDFSHWSSDMANFQVRRACLCVWYRVVFSNKRRGTFSFFGRRKKESELANSGNSRVQDPRVSSTHWFVPLLFLVLITARATEDLCYQYRYKVIHQRNNNPNNPVVETRTLNHFFKYTAIWLYCIHISINICLSIFEIKYLFI